MFYLEQCDVSRCMGSSSAYGCCVEQPGPREPAAPQAEMITEGKNTEK